MRLRDLPVGSTFNVQVRLAPDHIDKELPEIGGGKLEPDLGNKGAYRFFIDDKLYNIKITDENKINDFDLYMKRGCASLSEILVRTPDKKGAMIRTVFFYGDIISMGEIDIGIDNKILDTAMMKSIKEHGIPYKGFDGFAKELSDRLTITIGNETYIAAIFGNAAVRDFEDDKEGNDKTTDCDNASNKIAENKMENIEKFSIYGEDVKIPVEKRSLTLEGGIKGDVFSAQKIILGKHKGKDAALRLIKAKVTISDFTNSKTSRITAIAAGAMERLCNRQNSYLKTWYEYGRLEGELLLKKARDIGKINIHNRVPVDNGESIQFYIDGDFREMLSKDDSIVITDVLPSYLENQSMTFEEFENEVMSNDGSGTKSITVDVSVRNVTEKYIETENKDDIPIDGNVFIVYSVCGDKTQIKRKGQARKRIIEGRSANPMLGLLIEESDEKLQSLRRSVSKIEPLSPFVREKIFKHDPTERQKEAIEVALNTPDIALIQGPPGTGKTTVVTAIIERLNEEFDKTQNVSGQILVSGFQHDAVDNIIQRLSINSLPTARFGGKRKIDSYEDESGYQAFIDGWCEDIAKKIRAKDTQIEETEDQKRLNGLFSVYALNPSIKNAEAILKGIIATPVLPEKLRRNAQDVLAEISPELREYDHNVLILIYGLRTNKISFADDGKERILALLGNDKISSEMDDTDKTYLESITDITNEDIIRIKTIKGKLLRRFIARPKYRNSKQKESVSEICAEASKYLRKIIGSRDKKYHILLEFLAELETNPQGIREAIERHSFVFAATTGQCVARDVCQKKNVRFGDADAFYEVAFDTVIIDEAARVSPRDLMIPMSLGEKRIILVGDHRQLPHIVDEKIAEQLENASLESEDESKKIDILKKSMFQYMFERLKRLEEKDGIPRTVTLDAQYRMHPLLGEFVSDYFYKQHGEAYRSPLQEIGLFEQRLPGIAGKPAIWINVPYKRGGEKRNENGSRFRNIEADVIAKYLEKWLSDDCEESKKLTFGIISFYKAQLYEVYRELERNNISVKDERIKNRLKIGTVDSFQGMEFDVVFLSMVRTCDTKYLSQKSNDNDNAQRELEKRKQFGFLMSKNRLCVSMSRQKRALIVVGDGDLVMSKIGREAVPELVGFYELCKTNGAIL